jgi:hypothetical protein
MYINEACPNKINFRLTKRYLRSGTTLWKQCSHHFYPLNIIDERMGWGWGWVWGWGWGWGWVRVRVSWGRKEREGILKSHTLIYTVKSNKTNKINFRLTKRYLRSGTTLWKQWWDVESFRLDIDWLPSEDTRQNVSYVHKWGLPTGNKINFRLTKDTCKVGRHYENSVLTTFIHWTLSMT